MQKESSAIKCVPIHQEQTVISPIINAIKDLQSTETILYLTKRYIQHIDDRDEKGWTSLHHCVNIGNFESCKCLLKNGANVNLKNNLGETPLHMSCRVYYNTDFVELLLKHGADPNEKDNSGNIPLTIALTNNCSKNVNVLLKNCPTAIDDASNVVCVIKHILESNPDISKEQLSNIFVLLTTPEISKLLPN